MHVRVLKKWTYNFGTNKDVSLFRATLSVANRRDAIPAAGKAPFLPPGKHLSQSTLIVIRHS